MALSKETELGEAVDNGCVPAGSGVEGMSDHGDQAGFGENDGDADRWV